MEGPLRSRAPVWTAVAASLLVLGWWVLEVRYTHGGNWTGLYCTGTLFQLPPWLERQEAIVRDGGRQGYDGQIFHVLAHRPWPLGEIQPYLDPPQLRYQRILIPALAYTLALGRQVWIDPAYYSLMLALLGAGVYWTSRLAELRGASPWWGVAFLLLPSSLSAVDRMLVDGPLMASVAGFLFFWETGRWRWAALLAVAAPFIRETGMMLPAAAAAGALFRWSWAAAGKWALAGAPFGLWSLWLSRLPGGLHTHFAGLFHSIRLQLGQPVPVASPAWFGWVLYAAALLALVCLLGASTCVLYRCWRRRDEWSSSPQAALWFCGALFGASAWFISNVEPRAAWDDFYSSGRVFSPIFLAVFLDELSTVRPLAAGAFLLACSARIGLEFVSPALRILRGIAAG